MCSFECRTSSGPDHDDDIDRWSSGRSPPRPGLGHHSAPECNDTWWPRGVLLSQVWEMYRSTSNNSLHLPGHMSDRAQLFIRRNPGILHHYGVWHWVWGPYLGFYRMIMIRSEWPSKEKPLQNITNLLLNRSCWRCYRQMFSPASLDLLSFVTKCLQYVSLCEPVISSHWATPWNVNSSAVTLFLLMDPKPKWYLPDLLQCVWTAWSCMNVRNRLRLLLFLLLCTYILTLIICWHLDVSNGIITVFMLALMLLSMLNNEPQQLLGSWTPP